MSTNRNLARLPAATMSGVLSRIAAGLRGDTTDILDLRVDQVCLRTLSMIRTSSPFLDKSLAIGLPIALLGIGIWQHIVILVKLRSGVQQAYSSCLCNLSINGSHRLNKLVCNYLSTQGVGQDSRSLTISAEDSFRYTRVPDDDDDTPSVKYLPASTTHAWFQFNGNWIKFARAVPEKVARDPFGSLRPALQPEITLSCFSLTGNIQPIKEFLEHLQGTAKAKKHTMIEILRYSAESKLMTSIHRPSRKLDSVSMSATKKHEMITDMTSYLASENWYADRGIPWRRGYLLYGPPGTGKTSIATAIAGHFCIPLVIIGLSQPGMNDASLQSAFDYLPHKCVVILEDLDSAGIGRETTTQQAAAQESSKEEEIDTSDCIEYSSPPKPKSPLPPSNITLSGLLNAIDGPASHEGRILIATTNSPDSLDPALLRPGRIDMKILFGNATAEVTECLFAHIFEDPSDRERSACDVAQMARKFAALVPEDALTPAEIQNFLLRHREDPFRALEGVEEWVQETLAVKNSKGNVERFEGQI